MRVTMITIEHLGGAQSVTGSKHLVRTKHAVVLLECGLFQGRREESFERNRKFGIDAQSVDSVVLSHAHIDHSGALPLLVKQGFRGPVYTTPATRDLAAPMLEDAAMIQQQDARHIARLIERGERDVHPVEPLYSREDVVTLLGQLVSVPYHRAQEVGHGVRATFLDAGHVLGSAIVVLDVDDEGTAKRLVFTGDLGRHHLPILRDPEFADGAHVLMMESTYGDRLHDPIETMASKLADVVKRTFARGGKVIIPSFSLERSQEILYELKRLELAGQLPRKTKIYVDSPLTVKLTDVFKLHPECYDEEAAAMFSHGASPFEMEGLEYVEDVEASKAIDAETTPSIIISASGMVEAGRVLHHLRATVQDSRNTIVIVGFQAEHTLGRRLVELRPEVRIFGVKFRRDIEVVVLNGFSAHADQKGLVDYVVETKKRGPLSKVILVHGEPKAQNVLGRLINDHGVDDVVAPKVGDTESF